jgi:LPXTG-motif cell wall-anchored protein
MQPAAIAVFGATLFLALAALITWKRRRDLNAARVNRGLRGYVAARSAVQLPGPEETHGENLIPI